MFNIYINLKNSFIIMNYEDMAYLEVDVVVSVYNNTTKM